MEDLKGSFRYKACDLTDPDHFEECLEDVDGEVIIICEGIMIMKKDVKDGSVKCNNVDDIIYDIFETTGFVDILDL